MSARQKKPEAPLPGLAAVSLVGRDRGVSPLGLGPATLRPGDRGDPERESPAQPERRGARGSTSFGPFLPGESLQGRSPPWVATHAPTGAGARKEGRKEGLACPRGSAGI